ncbi:hypothetical protein [Marinifilum breve]|nr:hypothetical protein [Marinifilum breve]
MIEGVNLKTQEIIKMLKRVICIIGFFSVFTQSVRCQLISERLLISQKDRQNKEYVVGKIANTTPLNKSLTDYFQIVDTLDFIQNSEDIVEVRGCDFHFKVTISRDSMVYSYGDKKLLQLESHISPYQLWEYDITNLNSVELDSVSKELREKPYHKPVLSTSFNQSCISYALEGIFRSHGINPEPFFFRRSNPKDHSDLEIILKNLFVKVETIHNINRNTLKGSKHLKEEQVFLLFKNAQAEPMHACFNLYGKTWTKNGLKPYTSHPSPQFVIDTYTYSGDKKKHSVCEIEIYKLKPGIFE